MKEITAHYSFLSRIPLLIIFSFGLSGIFIFKMYEDVTHKEFEPLTLSGLFLFVLGITMLSALVSKKPKIEISKKGITCNNLLSWLFKPYYAEWGNILEADYQPMYSATVIPIKNHYIKITYKRPIEKHILCGLIKYNQSNAMIDATGLNINPQDILESINYNAFHFNRTVN